jgi:hypothetical protein
MYARDRFPDTKKVFQSRAILGRYCNGVGSKNSNGAPRARRDASLNHSSSLQMAEPSFAKLITTPDFRKSSVFAHTSPGNKSEGL